MLAASGLLIASCGGTSFDSGADGISHDAAVDMTVDMSTDWATSG